MATTGLTAVFTGDGKGKTTAALGLAFRALGHEMKVAVIQFIKGSWDYGEIHAAKRFQGLLDFHVMGKGFTWKSDNLEEDIALARQAWDFAVQTVRDDEHAIVILDELTYLISYEMIKEEDVLALIKEKPPSMHLIITGRGASAGLRQAADLVTEMRAEKHPYEQGIMAQKGIEF